MLVQVAPTRHITLPAAKAYTFVPLTGSIICRSISTDMQETPETAEATPRKRKVIDEGNPETPKTPGTTEASAKKKQKVHDENVDDDGEVVSVRWHALGLILRDPEQHAHGDVRCG